MSATHERLRARIRALRDKTVARGCTEAEALAAAELAARLMAEHGLDSADLDAGSERIAVAAAPFWHATLVRAACVSTNCVSVASAPRGGAGTLEFIGREPGPTIAVYLRETALHAVDTALAAFKAGPAYGRLRLHLHRDWAEHDFLQLCAGRLASRLIETFRPLRDEAAHAQAVDLRDRLHPGTQPLDSGRRWRLRDEAAAAAGLAAANAVGLHHGVAGQRGGITRIGGRA